MVNRISAFSSVRICFACFTVSCTIPSPASRPSTLSPKNTADIFPLKYSPGCILHRGLVCQNGSVAIARGTVMDAYTPVSCDFSDELESLATLRQKCRIVYHNDADKEVEAQGLIVDIYAANHADYLKLEDGTEIRLDRIVSVDDKPVSFASE